MTVMWLLVIQTPHHTEELLFHDQGTLDDYVKAKKPDQCSFRSIPVYDSEPKVSVLLPRYPETC